MGIVLRQCLDLVTLTLIFCVATILITLVLNWFFPSKNWSGSSVWLGSQSLTQTFPLNTCQEMIFPPSLVSLAPSSFLSTAFSTQRGSWQVKKPCALLTTASSWRTLAAQAQVGARFPLFWLALFGQNSLSMLKSTIIARFRHLLLSTHRLKSCGIIANPAFCSAWVNTCEREEMGRCSNPCFFPNSQSVSSTQPQTLNSTWTLPVRKGPSEYYTCSHVVSKHKLVYIHLRFWNVFQTGKTEPA